MAKKDDEIYCPECGGYIKKGFMTCTNCKMKIKLTKQMDKEEEDKKKKR